MEAKLLNLTWHDAELLELRVDRTNPGNDDTVIMELRTIEGTFRIRFLECRSLQTHMNFGIIATESVRDVTVLKESPELEKVRDIWRAMTAGLDLTQYNFEFNSTSSLITIICESVSIEPIGLV